MDKKKEDLTLVEINQKIEVVEIQLKQLFNNYQVFIQDFLRWETDDIKHQNLVKKSKFKQTLEEIIKAQNICTKEIESYLKVVKQIMDKVEQSKSISMKKSMKHKLFIIDETLVRCNVYSFLIGESCKSIAEIVEVGKKRLLS